MAEEEAIEITSSQESLLLSQEAFELVWNDFASIEPVEFQPDDKNFPFMNGMQNEDSTNWRSLKLETPDFIDALEEQNILNNEALLPGEQNIRSQVIHSVPQDVTQVPVSSVQHAHSSLPASQTWPGEYNFSVSFSPQEKNTKGIAWTYSAIKDKLYVGKDVACPVNFSANTILPNDVHIRVLALYTSPGQVKEIVHRCVNHSMEELKNGVFEAEHLIRCENDSATYHVDPVTHRHSVIVPFENPQAGQNYTTCIYKFACFGSCSGGPNRRPLMLIFTLERGNQVIGRRKLDVKICACPGRDRKSEEEQVKEVESNSRQPAKRKKPEMVTLSECLTFTQDVSLPAPKKSKACPNKDGAYCIQVEDKGCYEFLLQMKYFHEMCKTVQSLSPDVTKTLLYFQRKKKEEKE